MNWSSQKYKGRKQKKTEMEEKTPDDLEKVMKTEETKCVTKPKQILRVKSLTELGNSIRKENESLLPNPHVRTLIRVLNPKEIGNKSLTEVNSGVKFIGSTRPQLPNQQPKKIFIIRHPNSNKGQITGRPQLFTLPGNPGVRKFVLKEVPKSFLKSNLVLHPQGGKTFVANPIAGKETSLGSSSKSPILKPVRVMQIPIGEGHTDLGVRSYVIKNQVVRKEMVLLPESIRSEESGTPEPRILKDPIDIGDSIPVENDQINVKKETETTKIFVKNHPLVDDLVSTSEDDDDDDNYDDESTEISAGTIKPVVKKQKTNLIDLTSASEEDEEPSTSFRPYPTLIPKRREVISTSNEIISGKRPSNLRKQSKNPEMKKTELRKTETKTESRSVLKSQPIAKPKAESQLKLLASKYDEPLQHLDFLDDLIFADLHESVPQTERELDSEETLSLPEEIYPCAHCNRDFQSYTELVKHWIALKHVCETCGEVFPFASLLEMHVKDVHGIKGYKCSNCNFFDSNLWKLKIHRLRGHCREYQHPCDDCDRAFSSSEELQTHVKEVHESSKKTNVLCDFCGQGLMNYYSLKCHIRLAHLNKKFTCKQCGKQLYTRATYGRHLRWHKMKTIVCEHCGKKFDIQSDLKVHLRQHTGEKPYICSICSKAFAKRTTLRQHLLIHTGKRPYVCDICGKTFTQKPGLTAHRKSHPGDLPHMPCLFIDDLLKELPDNAFGNLGPKSKKAQKNDEEKEDDAEELERDDEEQEKSDADGKEEDEKDEDETDMDEKDIEKKYMDEKKVNKVDENIEENEGRESLDENETNLDNIEASVMEMMENEAILEMDANEVNILENILEDAVNSTIENEIENLNTGVNTKNVNEGMENAKEKKRKSNAVDDLNSQNVENTDRGELKNEEMGSQDKVTENKIQQVSTNTRPKRMCTKKRRW